MKIKQEYLLIPDTPAQYLPKGTRIWIRTDLYPTEDDIKNDFQEQLVEIIQCSKVGILGKKIKEGRVVFYSWFDLIFTVLEVGEKQ